MNDAVVVVLFIMTFACLFFGVWESLRASKYQGRVWAEQDKREALQSACQEAVADLVERQGLCNPDCPIVAEFFDDRTIAIAEGNWKLLEQVTAQWRADEKNDVRRKLGLPALEAAEESGADE